MQSAKISTIMQPMKTVSGVTHDVTIAISVNVMIKPNHQINISTAIVNKSS